MKIPETHYHGIVLPNGHGRNEACSLCMSAEPQPQTTITVSIGRKVGLVPMSSWQWDRFQNRTTALVQASLDHGFGDILFTGLGTGRWTDHYGHTQIEDSFTLVATIDGSLVDELAARLSILAEVFGQDAIAVTVGQTRLCEWK